MKIPLKTRYCTIKKINPNSVILNMEGEGDIMFFEGEKIRFPETVEVDDKLVKSLIEKSSS